MGISYKPLWKLLVDKELSKLEFARTVNISHGTLAKFGKGMPVALEVIERICIALDCKIEDVVEIINKEKE
jgi:DNA-binding Xre family transcriptional regulator